MVEPDAPSGVAPGHNPDSVPVRRRAGIVRFIVWCVLSLAFLGYVLLGSVNARFWKFDVLQFQQEFAIEPKSIARIWRVQAGNLPDISRQWIMEAGFYVAIATFVICVIAGMYLLLDQAANDPAPVSHD